MFHRAPLVLLAVAAVGLGACSSAPTPTPIADPKEILTRAVATVQAAKTVHLSATVTGSVVFDLTGSGSATPLKLDGTTAEGDLDVAGGKAKLSFSAPAFLGLTGDLIVIGQDSYARLSLLGSKYQKSTNAASALGSTGLGALADPASAIADLQKSLDALPNPPVRGPDEKCGDHACYVVTVDVPSTGLGAALGGIPGLPTPSGAGASGAGASGAPGQGSLQVWVDQQDLRPVRLLILADGGPSGQLAIDVALTNWDAGVSIAAPPADEVETPSPS